MKLIKLVSFFTMFAFLLSFNAYAKKRAFEIKKIDFNLRGVSMEDSLIKGLDKSKLSRMGKTQQWGVVRVNYESYPQWADDVDIKCYALLKSKKERKKNIMLASSTTYIDVEKGRDHYAYIYIPPQVLRRYGKVLNIRVEIWYNGTLQDEKQWPKRGSKIPWWTRIKPTYGSMMNRHYTPFQFEAQITEELIKMK